MKYAILGALDQEVAQLCSKMTITTTHAALGTLFYEGTLYGHPVVVVCCGIGKVNAASCATYVLYHLNCDAIINVGIAGAVAHGLKTLDVVISRELCFHDQDAIMLNYFPKTKFFQADETLYKACEKVCQKPDSLTGKYLLGRIASGDVFVADRTTRDRIIAAVAPDCVEMEGAAIAHVAFAAKKPVLVIRTMSDCADDETTVQYDNFLERAANQSAHIILAMLRDELHA